MTRRRVLKLPASAYCLAPGTVPGRAGRERHHLNKKSLTQNGVGARDSCLVACLPRKLREVIVIELHQVYDPAGRSPADLRSLICPTSYI